MVNRSSHKSVSCSLKIFNWKFFLDLENYNAWQGSGKTGHQIELICEMAASLFFSLRIFDLNLGWHWTICMVVIRIFLRIRIFHFSKKINISVFQSVKNKRFDSKMIYPSRNDEFDTNCIYCILDHFKGCTIFSTRKPIFASNLNKKIIFNNLSSTILSVFSFWSIL